MRDSLWVLTLTHARAMGSSVVDLALQTHVQAVELLPTRIDTLVVHAQGSLDSHVVTNATMLTQGRASLYVKRTDSGLLPSARGLHVLVCPNQERLILAFRDVQMGARRIPILLAHLVHLTVSQASTPVTNCPVCSPVAPMGSGRGTLRASQRIAYRQVWSTQPMYAKARQETSAHITAMKATHLQPELIHAV
jgi:hypothetical protein